MKFGLSHYAIGIRRDIPLHVERTLSYWINELMVCNPVDPNGGCTDGNLADFYVSQGGTGHECGYVANPVPPPQPAISPFGIAGIVVAASGIAICIYRCFHRWQMRRQQERIQLLETYQRRLRLLDKVAEVQREYLESNNPKIVYQTLLEGIVELMDSAYGVMGEVKRDEETGKLYLHIDASVQQSDQGKWESDVSTETRTTIGQATVEAPSADAGSYHRNKDHNRWRDPVSRALINRVLTSNKPLLRNNVSSDAPLSGDSAINSIKASIEDFPTDAADGLDDVEQVRVRNLLPLENFLGIPFFAKGGQEISGMIAIANKKGGYTEGDVQFLEPFSATVTNLVQAFWQIARNELLINTLEKTVQERTEKLQTTNRELAEANERVTRASATQLTHFASMSHEVNEPGLWWTTAAVIQRLTSFTFPPFRFAHPSIASLVCRVCFSTRSLVQIKKRRFA